MPRCARAVARQRANFGSSGISSDSGSGQAVLLGLFDETEDELARREQLDNLRNRALDLGGGTKLQSQFVASDSVTRTKFDQEFVLKLYFRNN